MECSTEKPSSFRMQFSLKTFLVVITIAAAFIAYTSHRTVELESSSIKSVTYSPWTKTLEVQFTSDAIYRYSDVPRETYDGLINAKSHGAFFHQQIRNGEFEYEQLD